MATRPGLAGELLGDVIRADIAFNAVDERAALPIVADERADRSAESGSACRSRLARRNMSRVRRRRTSRRRGPPNWRRARARRPAARPSRADRRRARRRAATPRRLRRDFQDLNAFHHQRSDTQINFPGKMPSRISRFLINRFPKRQWSTSRRRPIAAQWRICSPHGFLSLSQAATRNSISSANDFASLDLAVPLGAQIGEKLIRAVVDRHSVRLARQQRLSAAGRVSACNWQRRSPSRRWPPEAAK